MGYSQPCHRSILFNLENTKAPLPICLTTVDQSSTHNVVIWDKSTTTGYNNYAIYRETTSGNYTQLGIVSGDSLSEYHDYGADPNTTSYRYAIKVLDTCGTQSEFSNYHGTIHLQHLGGGNFQWTSYEIENESSPASFYTIYRDDNGTGNYQALNSTISGSNTTYTDTDFASYPDAEYYMEAVWSITCSSSKAGLSTISNKKSLKATDIEKLHTGGFSFYPSPAEDVLHVNGSFGILKIYNSLGGLVLTSTESSIDISMLNGGLYFIEVGGNVRKFIKK